MFAQFIDEAVAPHPDLEAVEISKRREIHTVAGCTAELADVVIAGHEVQTAALESVDLDALRELRRRTGLEGHDNVNYPRAIKRTLAGAADQDER
jgi:hypothetical protein